MVLQNIGPLGHPGMPEAGYIPIPRKLAEQGVKDMVRISDGRMSGTASGAVVLHIAPEAAAGGPLWAVRDGDTITIDVETRSLHLGISDEELENRLKAFRPLEVAERGYKRLYQQNVLQADTGADFGFLRCVE